MMGDRYIRFQGCPGEGECCVYLWVGIVNECNVIGLVDCGI